MVTVRVGYTTVSGEIVEAPDHYPRHINFHVDFPSQLNDKIVEGIVNGFLQQNYDETLPDDMCVWWAQTDIRLKPE